MAVQAFALGGSDGNITGTGATGTIVKFYGAALYESGAAAGCTVAIREGSGGRVLCTLVVATSGAQTVMFPQPILCAGPLYEDKIVGSGTYVGSVFIQ